MQQELQVFFAAVLQKLNDFLRGRTKREAVVGWSRTTTHQTHENSSSAESSQIEGRAVVGRRVRDLVFLHGFDNLRFFECPGVVLVDPAREPGGGRRDASTAYEPRRRRDARKLEVE